MRLLPLALVCLAATAAAQTKAEPAAPTGKRPGTEHTFRGNCSEAQSRDLFTACDGDGNDRLDVFEAHDALDAMRDLRDAETFARLDTDRDGYVAWPEFDAWLRSALQYQGSFRVRTVRKLAPTAPEAKAASALQQFLQLHDRNGNGGLDPDELEALLRAQPALAPLGAQLRKLDLDGSGRIDEAELAPWFEQVPGRAPAGAAPAADGLPPPWGSVDDDRTGSIDAAELARLLRRLDPTLERVAPALLRALDRDKDGVLRPDELPGRGGGRASGPGKSTTSKASAAGPEPAGDAATAQERPAADPLPLADGVR